jgi:carbonic anhydrase
MTETTSPTARRAEGHALLPDRLVSGYEAFLGGRFAYEQERFHRLAEAG